MSNFASVLLNFQSIVRQGDIHHVKRASELLGRWTKPVFETAVVTAFYEGANFEILSFLANKAGRKLEKKNNVTYLS